MLSDTDSSKKDIKGLTRTATFMFSAFADFAMACRCSVAPDITDNNYNSIILCNLYNEKKKSENNKTLIH